MGISVDTSLELKLFKTGQLSKQAIDVNSIFLFSYLLWKSHHWLFPAQDWQERHFFLCHMEFQNVSLTSRFPKFSFCDKPEVVSGHLISPITFFWNNHLSFFQFFQMNLNYSHQVAKAVDYSFGVSVLQ